MKKKIIISIVALLILSFGICSLAKIRNSSILYDNIEALAGTEGGSGVMCSQTGSLGSFYMKRCSDCNSFGRYAMDSVAYCNL